MGRPVKNLATLILVVVGGVVLAALGVVGVARMFCLEGILSLGTGAGR